MASSRPSGSRDSARPTRPHTPKFSERVEADLAQINARLGSHDRRHKVSDVRQKRLARMLAELGNRVAEDHDSVSVMAGIMPRIARLEELVRDGMRLNLAALLVDFTSVEIERILNIQKDEELTDQAIVAGMMSSIGLLKAELDQVVGALADTRGVVNQQGERLDQYGQRMDSFDTDFTDFGGSVNRRFREHAEYVTRRFADLRIVASFPLWGWLAAAVAFFAGWLIILMVGNDLTGEVHGTGKSASKVVGTFHAQLHYGWFGFFVGLLLAGIVLAISQRYRIHVDDQRTTTTTTTTAAATNGSPAPDPAPTRVMPAVPAADTRTHS